MESEKRYGNEIVDLVRGFLLSRGQPTTEAHRLRGNMQVFGAPLSALVRHARKKKLPCSRTAIYNLFSKKFKRQKNTKCRGVIEATVARKVSGEKRWHSRSSFSAELFKYGKQLVVMVNTGTDIKQGKLVRVSKAGSACQLDIDDMAKVPYYIAARQGSSPAGFVLKREDGKPSFAELDHAFPLERNCLMTTTGVVCGAHDREAELEQGAKPQIKTCRPASMDIFIRPYLYMDVGVISHFEDLFKTMASRNQASQADVLLCGIDNGAGSIHLKPK